jgi:hypothetical protein
MTSPQKYLIESQRVANIHSENRWFHAEVGFFSAAGRILSILKDRLVFGVGLDKVHFLEELSDLLWWTCELSVCSSAGQIFCETDWRKFSAVVPGGYNGCASAILSLMKSEDPGRRIQSLSVACSHLGVTWDQICDISLNLLAKKYPKVYS